MFEVKAARGRRGEEKGRSGNKRWLWVLRKKNKEKKVPTGALLYAAWRILDQRKAPRFGRDSSMLAGEWMLLFTSS